MRDNITITLTWQEATLITRLLDAMHIAARARHMAGLVDSEVTDQIEDVMTKIDEALLEENENAIRN